MFNFSEAFGYLFKEKKWGLKFIIPYILTVILTVPSFIYSLTTQSKLNSFDYTSYLKYGTSYYTTNVPSGVSTLFACFVLIFAIPTFLVGLWYSYENIQAAIQKRKTVGLWENKAEDTLKKVGKYFLVYLIYALVIIAITFIVTLVVGMVAACFIGLLVSSAGVKGSFTAASVTSAGVVGVFGFFALICCITIVAFLFSIVLYTLVMTSFLRLIATNSIGEAFQFSDNLRISKKYKGKFISMFFLILLWGIFIGIITYGLTLIGQSLYANSSLIGIMFMVVVEVILAIPTVYMTHFVYTRLLGQLYRDIVKKEEALSYIATGE